MSLTSFDWSMSLTLQVSTSTEHVLDMIKTSEHVFDMKVGSLIFLNFESSTPPFCLSRVLARTLFHTLALPEGAS